MYMLKETASIAIHSFLLLGLGASLAALPAAAIAAPVETAGIPTFQLPIKVDENTTVRIDGDSGMAVMNQFLKEQYQQQFPGTQVEIEASGTDSALQRLLQDEIDLAAIGRSLTTAEKAKGLMEIPLSDERIAVIVGQDNPFKGSLTVDQFAKVIRGEITDWAEVGGAPGAIRLIDRPVTSDTRVALKRYGIFEPDRLAAGAQGLQLDTDDTAEVIRQLGRDGLSYAIYSQLLNQNKARIVNLVVMHEARPDDPLYPYAQPRGYAYKKSPDLAASSFLGLATAGSGVAAIDAAKATEAQTVFSALNPPPQITLTQTPEPADSPSAQTLKALPLWLRLVLPLGLLGLLLQAVLKWLERKPATSAPVATASPIAPAPMPEPPLEAEIIEPTPLVPAAPATPEPPTVEPPAPVVTPAALPDVTPNTIISTEAIAPVMSDMAASDRPSNYWLDYQQVYERGVGLVDNGEYSAALGCFNRAIELNPAFSDAWIAKSGVLVKLGQFAEARTTLDRAGQLRPDDATINRSWSELAEQERIAAQSAPPDTVTPEPVAATSWVEPSATEPAIAATEGTTPPPLAPLPVEEIQPAPEPAIAPSAIGTVNPTASVIPVGDGQIGYPPELFKASFRDNLLRFQGQALEHATPQDLYTVLAYMVRDRLLQLPSPESYLTRPDVRWVGELSAEYLPGPYLMNNLLNLGIVQSVRQGLQELGLNLDDIAQQEEEPGLGKGGLGRLMVCYLDSLSTAAIPAIGYGIRYEYGIFDQQIQDGWQIEVPDTWLQSGNPWEIERPEGIQSVSLGGYTEAYLDEQSCYRVRWIAAEVVQGVPYDTPILGYQATTVSLLRLWRADTNDALCKTLYPIDRDEQGRTLRLKQQFFLISCSLQDAIRLHLQAGQAIALLHERLSLQLNDTDAALAVAELMRLLVDDHGIAWAQAWAITQQTLSYTNHSLMPETLDDLWSIGLLETVLPRHLEIVLEINGRFLDEVRQQAPDDLERIRRLSLIREEGDRYLRLTHLACVGCHAINGVSRLHTQLLEQKILPDFYSLYPEKFSHQTNGVSPRRFLLLTHPALAGLITQRIGDRWIVNLADLTQLYTAADDAHFRQEWRTVKQAAKQTLATYIQQQTGIVVDIHSLFDGQAMVIHEYKRQHLNVLHILTLYNRIKANPTMDITPRTFIFSGKAAPDYAIAKLIIRLIHAVADVVNTDADVRGRLKVVFLPDFTIKSSQLIYPALELSEHISTAGTEACDTGNMIAALNGALIIGTPDGSNLEIQDAIGAENCFQFGKTVAEVEAIRSQGYHPATGETLDPELKGAIAHLTSGLLANGDRELFKPLVDLLQFDDRYLLLADYNAYVSCQERVSLAYRNPDHWTQLSIRSTARMGQFSSDRAMQAYSQTIWHVKPVTALQEYAKQN